MAPTIKQPGEILSDEPPKSLTYAGSGAEGSGKSKFALSGPDPIFVCGFDPYGVNRVGKQFRAREDGTKKTIRIGRYSFNPKSPEHLTNGKYDSTKIARAATELWDRFIEDYYAALKAGFRLITWDREDLAYELQRYAKFGIDKAQQKDYGDLFVEYAGLIQEAPKHGVNLGLLRGLREKWVSKWDASKAKMVGHGTGEMIPDGMKKVSDHVDITLSHRWDDKWSNGAGKPLGGFITKIDKFTNAEYRGQEFQDLTFPMMAMAAFPDSNPEDWQ